MPVIYVSIREGNAPEQKKRIAAGIHKAMIDVMGLPEDDYNQVFLESSADNMIFDPNYFGLYRSPKAVFIHMFFNHRPAEMKAKLEKLSSETAEVSLGAAKFSVPSRPLAELKPGATVDLFVRPEHLHLSSEAGAPIHGVVAASIYQGDHVDLYIDLPQAASGRIHMRLSAREAAGLAGNGAKVSLSIASEDLVAFPEVA